MQLGRDDRACSNADRGKLLRKDPFLPRLFSSQKEHSRALSDVLNHGVISPRPLIERRSSSSSSYRRARRTSTATGAVSARRQQCSVVSQRRRWLKHCAGIANVPVCVHRCTSGRGCRRAGTKRAEGACRRRVTTLRLDSVWGLRL